MTLSKKERRFWEYKFQMKPDDYPEHQGYLNFKDGRLTSEELGYLSHFTFALLRNKFLGEKCGLKRLKTLLCSPKAVNHGKLQTFLKAVPGCELIVDYKKYTPKIW